MEKKPPKTVKKPPSDVERPQRELEKRIFHLKTLYDLSQDVGFLSDSKEIMNNLLMMVMGTFGALRGMIFVADTKKGEIEALTQRSMDSAAAQSLAQAIEDGYFKEMEKVPGVQILVDRDQIQKKEGKRIFELLAAFGIHAWIPFEVKENMRGGIGLGGKLSGDSYNLDDQELLSTLANQGAVAIKNAKLIEQMRKEETVRTNLARYLSPQIVDQVIQKDMQINLGGDRKVVTVLFSDIRNFTTITESLPPEQLIQILNEYFTKMAGIIFENQGSLDKYIGDAIVAVFGSLIPVKNSAHHAVQAAVQMMKRLPALNDKWMKEYGFNMSIGIGINTGEVFLGNIGSPERMEFTVIGDAVNVASRFSGLASPGQILLTRGAINSLGSDIKYKELPPSDVKGKTGKLEVFEIPYE